MPISPAWPPACSATGAICANNWVKIERRIQPNPDAKAIYDRTLFDSIAISTATLASTCAGYRDSLERRWNAFM